jgi:hypothetical protein
MITPEAWAGVQYFLDNYVKPTADDFAVVAYTPDSRGPAAWLCVALRDRGVVVEDVWMTPISDGGILERFRSVLVDPSELKGRLIVVTLERDTMSHDSKIKEAIQYFDKDRRLIFRAISACEELFSSALRANPEEINALNATLLTRLTKARKLHIETPSGSNIDVVLNNERHQWISNRGKHRPGRIAILPPGEVATFPADVSGVFVADFAFNLNAITQRDTRLNRCPITVKLKGGRAIDFHCADEEISSFIAQCFEQYCASNVGELGFGTNRRIGDAIAMNSHINERKPGIHLGFGQHNQDHEIVAYRCAIHLDLIAAGGSVWVDGDVDAINLADFQALKSRHPAQFRDEDVFSPDLEDLEVEDCCGILRQGQNGLSLFEPR